MAAASTGDDSFVYPIPMGEQSISLMNSLSWIRGLYSDAGRLKSQQSSCDNSHHDEVTASWFTTKTKIVPGDVLTIVDTLTYPTPRGMHTLSRARVEQVFDRRYLLELEESATLRLYSYTELDQLRFAFVAMMDLVEGGKVFDKDGQLTGLAKRDIKKNCSEKSVSEKEVPVVAAPSSGGVPPRGSVQKFLRGILEDECTAKWPHTPVAKSCVFSVDQDPTQPRHKPRFQATVELPLLGGKGSVARFQGVWMGNRRDAENSAAESALKMLHAAGKKK